MDRAIGLGIHTLQTAAPLFIVLVIIGVVGLAAKPIIRAAPITEDTRNRLLHVFRYANFASHVVLCLMLTIVVSVTVFGGMQMNEALKTEQSGPAR